MEVAEWRVAVGARIRGLRQNPPYRYTHKDLVLVLERMYSVSITESQIEKIESGKSFPGYELLRIFRDHFETNFDFLLGVADARIDQFPELFIYPEIQALWKTTRAAGIADEDTVQHIRKIALVLIEFTRSIRPELQPNPENNRLEDDNED